MRKVLTPAIAASLLALAACAGDADDGGLSQEEWADEDTFLDRSPDDWSIEEDDDTLF